MCAISSAICMAICIAIGRAIGSAICIAICIAIAKSRRLPVCFSPIGSNALFDGVTNERWSDCRWLSIRRKEIVDDILDEKAF